MVNSVRGFFNSCVQPAKIIGGALFGFSIAGALYLENVAFKIHEYGHAAMCHMLYENGNPKIIFDAEGATCYCSTKSVLSQSPTGHCKEYALLLLD